MKRICFALCTVAFISSFCFAQQPSELMNETASKPVEIKSFAGKVISVSLEDTISDVPARIVVVDEGGQRLIFL